MATTEPSSIEIAFNVVGFIASVASLIVSIGAIWLSIVFYRMSTTASNATTEASKGIGASVERLEKLFDKLYSDTFSMMRDTVSDMRKHIWPTDDADPPKALDEAEKKADLKISELKEATERNISEVLQRQRIADDKVDSLRGEMRRLVEHAIVGSRNVEFEAREETIREHILRSIRILRRMRPRVTAEDILDRMRPEFRAPAVVAELERMRRDGLIQWDSASLRPNAELKLVGPVVEDGPGM